MKFIFADCLDYVDPYYDFEADASSPERRPYWDDMFPHEILGKAPYDGILISRAIVGDHLFKGKYSESQAMRFRRVGARNFLRFNRPEDQNKWIFGDCGAFQYAKLDEPPYTPVDMAEFYYDGDFTHGCSVDHIIFHFDPNLPGRSLPKDKKVAEDCQRRFDITLENARQFLKESRQICKHFTPIGVVQGWSPGSMAEAASELLKMGYDYLAIGGLVPLKSEDIHRALRGIFDKISYRPQSKIHLLGFEKANILDQFIGKYPITSIDTTSPLTKAFKDDKKNYYLNNGEGTIEYYTSIRIPQARENLFFQRATREGILSLEEILILEKQALDRVRKYAKGQNSLEDTLTEVLKYSRAFYSAKKIAPDKINSIIDSLSLEYKRTLNARPWERCKCKICKECSIEVLLFRASNRNKRRGIHNIKVFHDHIKQKRGM
ncbi:hypothetical protein C4565_05085 [Candidatus Parcubacteria bacterium]|nr:MAG: hypothetical protein C4565_05085 [Candidatus Parcubacteria bacterium]